MEVLIMWLSINHNWFVNGFVGSVIFSLQKMFETFLSPFHGQ